MTGDLDTVRQEAETEKNEEAQAQEEKEKDEAQEEKVIYLNTSFKW